MALEKNIEVGNTGLFCNYIKVQAILFEAENNLLQIQLGVYASITASHEGKEPVNRINLDCTVAELSGNGDIRAQAYGVIKGKSEFEGAKDV